MLRIIVFSLAAFIYLTSYSQNPDIKRTYHWYFPNKAGIDFSTGIAVADTNGNISGLANSPESSTSISDTCGNLLFYTNGDTVWNKNHQVMQNGTGLMGHASSQENSIIVPQPGPENIYHIFTTDADENGGSNGLRYTTIDMTLNGGSGGVIQKNTLLFTPCEQQLHAVNHSNGTDVWVMGHKKFTNDYYSYLVTNSGVASTPVITTIGNQTSTPNNNPYGWSIKFSPNGKKLATCVAWYSLAPDTLEIYDFDNGTGVLSNKISISPDTATLGVSFSPDNSKLYAICGGSSFVGRLYQFDATLTNTAALLNSKTLLASGTQEIIRGADPQLAPDGKIYFGSGFYILEPPYTYNDTFSIIHNPNLQGTSCNFQSKGLGLGSGSGWIDGVSLPHFVESFLAGPWKSICNTGIYEMMPYDSLFVSPNPFNLHAVLAIDDNENGNGVLKLFDITGRKIKEEGIRFDKGKALLESENIFSGIYFLQIHIENKIYSRKIIIN